MLNKFGFAVMLPLLFYYLPVLALVILGIIALILAIKALRIYINKNS
ncbi:MAG: hypothetical protein GX359_09500 [Clostridiales bacterium]|nr:hypothetical protein [Clostridiales bacterium]